MRAFDIARRHAKTVMRIGGALLIGVGTLQLTGAWTAMMAAVQAWVGGYQLLLAVVTARFTDLDTAHREWWQLWAELWLYAQRHPEAADQLIDVQDETREVIAEALSRGGDRLDDELVGVIHALWTGFMLYRLINPNALDAAAFGRGVSRLIDGQALDQPDETNPRPARPTRSKRPRTGKE